MAKRQFGGLIQKLRLERKYSLRELAKRAGIAFTTLSLLEHGRKAVGPKVVGRLAAAFGLVGSDRDEFLNCARECAVRNRLSGDNAKYPVWLLNWIPTALQEAGIPPEGFDVDHIAPKSPSGAAGLERNLLIAGDVPSDNEEPILGSNLTENVSIFKAPHHGAKTEFDVKLSEGQEVRVCLSLTIVPLNHGRKEWRLRAAPSENRRHARRTPPAVLGYESKQEGTSDSSVESKSPSGTSVRRRHQSRV